MWKGSKHSTGKIMSTLHRGVSNKSYKVWIEIEEYDHDTEEGQTLDAPGASVADFDTYAEAWEFAEKLTRSAGQSL